MQAIKYNERINISKQIPEIGQMATMAQLKQFSQTDIFNIAESPNEFSGSLKTVVFNMERGVNLEETLDFLKQHPDLRDIDVVLANELDDGNVRSGMKDVCKEIAEELGLNYVFGLEFIELANPNDEKGYHGNAIMSKWPITWAKSFYPAQPYDWYYSEQPRIGARVAIFAKINVCGKTVGLITAHLENRTDPQGRFEQMQSILAEAAIRFDDSIPIILGGDFNTYTFIDDDKSEILKYLAERQLAVKPLDVVGKEPLLSFLEKNRYDLRGCNDLDTPTSRETVKPENISFSSRVDWITAKNVKCTAHGVIKTTTKECSSWINKDCALARFDKSEISDHDAVWATFML